MTFAKKIERCDCCGKCKVDSNPAITQTIDRLRYASVLRGKFDHVCFFSTETHSCRKKLRRLQALNN